MPLTCWMLYARLLLALLVANVSAEKTKQCGWYPLQVVGSGEYANLATKKTTTCSEYSEGKCPFAVPFPDYSCLVNCISSPSECAAVNGQTPAVDKFVDDHLCVSCGITACENCIFTSAGRSACQKCFPGFVGVGGRIGAWDECVLWDHKTVLTIFGIFSAICGTLVLLVVLATFVGACRMTWQWHVNRKIKSISSVALGTPAQPLLDPEEQRHMDMCNLNKMAISIGLKLNVMSSIKASSLRKAESRLTRGSRQSKLVRAATFIKDTLNDQMVELGLGLQLFFNTQLFLIMVSAIAWLTAAFTSDASMFSGLERRIGSCVQGAENSPSDYAQEVDKYRNHAMKMQIASVLLWFVLVIASWCFHLWQKQFIESYDKSTASAEDYSLRLEGLPPHATSEKELKSILERELRMEGKVYGVAICYDALPFKERLEEMIEHVVEWDSVVNGWCQEDYATPIEELERKLARDKADLEDMLQSGNLRNSGHAFVVFNKQEDMASVLAERRGISYGVFSPREKRHHKTAEVIKTVKILKDDCEPAGLRYFEYLSSPKVMNHRRYFQLPMRMLLYIGIYAAVAQTFYHSMIKPWQDNLIEGAESSNSVKVIGKIVLGFNFVIQTMVMMDVEHAGFVRVSQIDHITFVWNAVLLLVTNAYVIMQECFREGIRWNLNPPDRAVDIEAWWEWQRTAIQSARIEKEVGDSLVGVLTDQIMMLYILGEVGNVLLPVVGYYFAIRFVFVWTIKGYEWALLTKVKSFILRFLKLHKRDQSLITAREAEKIQILMPLLLWMEYTYVVVFPAMAFITFYLLTDQSSVVCGWLLGFSVLFYLWQRYVMLWLYGKLSYDSSDSYDAFIRMWGVVVCMLPPAAVWWAWRLGRILEQPFAFLTMILVYLLGVLFYQFGLLAVDWYHGARDDGIDVFEEGGDPGYEKVIQDHGMSWWNLNPIYVLKNRHCPDLSGHEVQDDGVNYWPKHQHLQGYFEMGKEFKHKRNIPDDASPSEPNGSPCGNGDPKVENPARDTSVEEQLLPFEPECPAGDGTGNVFDSDPTTPVRPSGSAESRTTAKPMQQPSAPAAVRKLVHGQGAVAKMPASYDDAPHRQQSQTPIVVARLPGVRVVPSGTARQQVVLASAVQPSGNSHSPLQSLGTSAGPIQPLATHTQVASPTGRVLPDGTYSRRRAEAASPAGRAFPERSYNVRRT